MTQQELELPKGWVETKLGDIAMIEWGNTSITKKSYVEKGFLAYSATGPDGFLPEAGWDGNGVVLSAIGAQCGKCFYANGKWTAIKNTIVIQSQEKFVLNKYLYYYLNDQRRWNISGSGQPFITLKTSKENSVSLAPLNEQKRIVSKIGDIFSKIDSTKQSLEHSKLQLVQYRHSLLKSAFEGRLTEKWREQNNIESLDEILHIIDNDCKNSNYEIENKDQLIIPDDWKTLKIGRAIIFLGSGITPKGGQSNYQKSGIPFIRSQNVYPYGLHLENIAYVTKELHEEMSRTHTKDGDVLLNITGASIGRSCIIPNKFGDANVNQHVCIIRFHPKINSAFLSYWLNSIKFQTIISSTQQGETRQALNFNQIRGMPFPFCSEQEQEQIVSQIEQGFSLIQNSQRIVNSTLQTLETMRMSVLKQAFQGKLVTQDPNDEPAEILLERIKKQKS